MPGSASYGIRAAVNSCSESGRHCAMSSGMQRQWVPPPVDSAANYETARRSIRRARPNAPHKLGLGPDSPFPATSCSPDRWRPRTVSRRRFHVRAGELPSSPAAAAPMPRADATNRGMGAPAALESEPRPVARTGSADGLPRAGDFMSGRGAGRGSPGCSGKRATTARSVNARGPARAGGWAAPPLGATSLFQRNQRQPLCRCGYRDHPVLDLRRQSHPV